MHIGIDPDLSGALAVLDTVGALVALCDTPVLHLPMARGRAPQIRCAWLGGSPGALRRPTDAWAARRDPQAMPGQGAPPSVPPCKDCLRSREVPPRTVRRQQADPKPSQRFSSTA